jgi:hypothetical protein
VAYSFSALSERLQKPPHDLGQRLTVIDRRSQPQPVGVLFDEPPSRHEHALRRLDRDAVREHRPRLLQLGPRRPIRAEATDRDLDQAKCPLLAVPCCPPRVSLTLLSMAGMVTDCGLRA